MKEAGCRRVYLGLESGSQATLDLMKKQVTVEEGIRAVHLYREAGIEVAGFFIVGYPGETVSSIEETFRLALTLPLDEISFNVPYPLPGSRLFERLGGPDEGRDWESENEVTFVYRLGDRRSVAAAPHRGDHGGVRAEAAAGGGPRLIAAPTVGSLSSLSVGLSKALSTAGAALPQRRLISNCAWPFRIAKRIFVAETSASKVSVWSRRRPPCCRQARVRRGPILSRSAVPGSG